MRVGIDPLIGLIPGIGDTGAAMVSALALIQAARQGVPKIILGRMSVNILLNELIGIVPVFGDVFSFWFKSNARNHELIKQHARSGGFGRKATRGDWMFVCGVLLALVLIVGTGLAVTAYVVTRIIQYIGLW
jgi:hypothetical protein